jgi:mycofactocin precursor
MTVTTTDEGTAPVSATGPAAAPITPPASEGAEGLIAEDLLVEDVSIDGMCGVY